ncbi:MAG: formylglycine-generating enzyme family protein [Acidobacteria bacterium]|nr:formylglycine-generating enzyme family protein [Acidobacteriota bacterium]
MFRLKLAATIGSLILLLATQAMRFDRVEAQQISDRLEPAAALLASVRHGPQWGRAEGTVVSSTAGESDLAAVDLDLQSVGESDRPFMRYFTLTHLQRAGAQEPELRSYRAALSKLVNSLSWQNEITIPKTIDAAGTILRIDLRNYDWNPGLWDRVQKYYPYGVKSASRTYESISTGAQCELPILRADWFIARAALPPLYHEILRIPKTDGELEAKLGVNVAHDLMSTPGKDVWRAGFTESGISSNNRIVERHRAPYGAYWRAHSFSSSLYDQDITLHPMNFKRAGGEIIFSLPNGLQGYMITNAEGERLDQGQTDVVLVKGPAPDPAIYNGLSCMSCHTEGMRPFKDDVRFAIENSNRPDRNQVLALYVTQSEMGRWVAEDTERYRVAVEKTGNVSGPGDLISQLAEKYDEPLKADRAAAELGMPRADLTRAVQGDQRLQAAGLNALLMEEVKDADGRIKQLVGTVKRGVWETQFGSVTKVLGLGEHLKPELTRLRPAIPTSTGPVAVTSPARQPNPKVDALLGQGYFVRIPTGEFQMGSAEFDVDERPVHRVKLTWPFEIGRYEITQAVWETVMGKNPSYNRGPQLPVENVSWYEVQQFIRAMNETDSRYTYRLPTEAEWEYARRAGTGVDYAGPLDEFAWYADNSGDDRLDADEIWRSDSASYGEAIRTNKCRTHPVGQKQPNLWGLYDMAGNVWEWCQDWYDVDYYGRSSATDPQGPPSGSHRVVRGGSWSIFGRDCRSTVRNGGSPSRRNINIGFRLARTPR